MIQRLQSLILLLAAVSSLIIVFYFPVLQSGEISDVAARRLLGRRFYLTTADGNLVTLGKLQKTGEFGGKGSEFYVKKEIAARGQLEGLINAALKTANTDAITLRVKKVMISIFAWIHVMKENPDYISASSIFRLIVFLAISLLSN